MRNKKITAMTLMLASATLSVVMGGALLGQNAVAEGAAKYALTDVFTATETSRNIVTETIGSDAEANKVTAFALKDEDSVKIKRSLALKWYDKEENSDPAAKYFTTTFAFKELNFETVSLSMDTASAWATADDKTTNTINFSVESGELKVAVNKGDKHTVAYTAGGMLTLALKEGSGKDGEFTVLLNGNEVGIFENVGANYASYTANKAYPMTFKAESATDVVSTVLLYDING